MYLVQLSNNAGVSTSLAQSQSLERNLNKQIMYKHQKWTEGGSVGHCRELSEVALTTEYIQCVQFSEKLL